MLETVLILVAVFVFSLAATIDDGYTVTKWIKSHNSQQK